MKTTLNTVSIMWGVLKNSSLADQITGQVYKGLRPIGSTKEDVVVSAIATINIDLQQTVLNVNIHVPDIKVAANGAEGLMPDNARLEELADIAKLVLTDTYGNDWNFTIQQQVLIQDTDDSNHYINFRIGFFNFNILN